MLFQNPEWPGSGSLNFQRDLCELFEFAHLAQVYASGM
jgi:hypothetical protein